MRAASVLRIFSSYQSSSSCAKSSNVESLSPSRLVARDAIHRQWETVEADIARSRSARVGQTAATHAVEQAHDRYQAGTITQLDLLQAQRDSFAADVARIQADADLVNARAQLRLAAGQGLLKEGMQ